jgi:hypothetical protein
LTDVHQLPRAHPILLVVDLLSIQSGVNYDFDAVDCDGGLRYSGSKYQFMFLSLQENEPLLIGSDSAVERVYLKDARVDILLKDIAKYVNLVDPRTEDEDIALILLPDFAAVYENVVLNNLLNLSDGVRLVKVSVDDLNGVQSPRNLHDFLIEVNLKEFGIQGGTRDYHFEFAPFSLQLFDEAEDDVDAYRPLVRLINDET